MSNCRDLNSHKCSDNEIAHLTNKWIKYVTIYNNPCKIAKLFSNDAILVGTVSQIRRTGIDIQKYFDYFAKLPDIQVIHKDYMINHIGGNVWTNTAFITWKWKGLKNPIIARMTFIFRENKIVQLHSSALPELNKCLKKISGKP